MHFGNTCFKDVKWTELAQDKVQYIVYPVLEKQEFLS
jgi:hypothetical protein